MQALEAQEQALFEQLGRPLQMDKALAVGAMFPDFAMMNQFGRIVRLPAIIRKGPMVVTFYHGLWSPSSAVGLHALQSITSYLKRHLAQMVTVCCDPPAHTLETADELGLTMEMLSDIDCRGLIRECGLSFALPPDLLKVYRQTFGLTHAHFFKDPGSEILLPVNAIYVVDQQGVVAERFLSADFYSKPDWREVLKVVRNLDRLTKQTERRNKAAHDDQVHAEALASKKKKPEKKTEAPAVSKPLAHSQDVLG